MTLTCHDGHDDSDKDKCGRYYCMTLTIPMIALIVLMKIFMVGIIV